jgi:hypothetical protein
MITTLRLPLRKIKKVENNQTRMATDMKYMNVHNCVPKRTLTLTQVFWGFFVVKCGKMWLNLGFLFVNKAET